MSAWDEALRNEMLLAVNPSQADWLCKRLAPHLATRDAETWAQACEAMKVAIVSIAPNGWISGNQAADVPHPSRSQKGPPA